MRPDIVHVEDVGVIERAGGASFLLEAVQRLLSVQAGGEHLDGDVATELAVVGDEDAPHPAAADLLLDAVALVDPGRVRDIRDIARWNRRSALLGLAQDAPVPRCAPRGLASSGATRRERSDIQGAHNLKLRATQSGWIHARLPPQGLRTS